MADMPQWEKELHRANRMSMRFELFRQLLAGEIESSRYAWLSTKLESFAA